MACCASLLLFFFLWYDRIYVSYTVVPYWSAYNSLIKVQRQQEKPRVSKNAPGCYNAERKYRYSNYGLINS